MLKDEVASKVLACSSSALIVLLPVNRFSNKLAPKVATSILRNPYFWSFASFWLVSLILFINKLDSSLDQVLQIIKFVASDPNIFLWALPSLETCVLVNNNLCGKLFISIRITNNIWWKFQSYFSTKVSKLLLIDICFNWLFL